MPAKPPTGNKVSQKDFYSQVAEVSGCDLSDVTNILKVAEDLIESTAQQGHDLKLSIGTFKRADRDARVGRNPQTGESVDISAKNSVKFVLAKRFKEALN